MGEERMTEEEGIPTVMDLGERLLILGHVQMFVLHRKGGMS